MTTPLEPPFAIVGLGLLGGSVARAIRAAFPTDELLGVDIDSAMRRAALSAGTVNRALEAPGPSLKKCRVFFVCVPVESVSRVFEALAPHLAEGAIVTDVTAVKEPVMKWASDLMPDASFIGGHPLVSDERHGFEAGRSELLSGAPVVICPPGDTDASAATAGVVELWHTLGAKTMILSPREHDEAVAHTSHLPYLAALAQVALVAERPERMSFFNAVLAEATRLVDFSPMVMAAAVAQNVDTPHAVRRLAKLLERIAEVLETEPARFCDLASEMRDARQQLLVK